MDSIKFANPKGMNLEVPLLIRPYPSLQRPSFRKTVRRRFERRVRIRWQVEL